MAKYTFKVYPVGQSRTTYRTIEISGEETLDELCEFILETFDFIHEHLYEFCMDNRMYSQNSYQYAPEDGELSTDVMIDEIQHVPEFEDVLNSFLHIKNVDVYVTGSNARFLSKDVITTFRGRGYEIKVHPLSFSEYYPVSGLSMTMALRQHMLYGGLPQVVQLETDEQKSEFLKSLMEHTYLKDIVDRYKIRNTDVMDELLNILASSIGGLTNPTKLANTFESVKHEKVGNKTLSAYIEYLCDSFILEKTTRYDIKGKRFIDSPFKYYFIDEGLRNARLNFRQVEFTHLMENLIYNELRIMGFNVDVGVVPIQRRLAEDRRERVQLEVDFVCNLGSRRYYIQSAYRMPDEEKFHQEEASLRNIDDFLKRIIIVREDTYKLIRRTLY